MGNWTITADSKPVYDGFGTADYWNGNDWIYWHKAMVQKYGIDKANTIWVNAWLDGLDRFSGGRGIADGSGYAFNSVPLGDRTTNNYFRDYIKSNKTLYDTVYMGIGGVIAKPLGGAIDLATNAGDAVASLGSGASKTAKVIEYAVPILIVALGSLIIYRAYKGVPILKLA